jgi:peptide deformylase
VESSLSVLTILEFPDPRLRKKADSVTIVDEHIHQLIDDMFETMYHTSGIGLAATQVNVHKQVIVMDVSEEKNSPICLINPEILHKEGEFEYNEGCLSVPNFFEKITRAGNITITALNRDGVAFELVAHDLMATCIQHEMDHLNGKLFVDYLSPLKRQRIKSKLEKLHRQESRI